jgi:hypothetical protein
MTILQRIAKTESKNHCYRTFQNLTKPSTGGLSHILINNNDTITRIDDMTQM